MASRWFVFWIAMFVVAEVKDWGSALWFLLFAALTSDPVDQLYEKIKEKFTDEKEMD